MHRVPIQFVGKGFYKYFPFSRSNDNKLYIFFYSTFYIVFAVFGFITDTLFLPFIVIGNLIRNKGPLFYFQERLVRNSMAFRIIKLRTMIINTEEDG